MNPKAETEQGKGPVPVPADAAEASRPEGLTALDTGLETGLETPSAELSDQTRPRARMMEPPSPSAKKELDEPQPKPPVSEVKVLRPATPLRPLARSTRDEGPAPRYPGLERALGVARKVLPVVQKVLPLLEGNVPLTLANLLAPALEAPRRPVNLQPLEAAVDRLNTEQAELRRRLAEQTSTIQHFGEEVEALRAQADRNAREREELAEGLRKLRRRVYWIAGIGFLLLAASLAANSLLLVRLFRPFH